MKRLFLVLLLCPLFAIAQPQQWYRGQLGDWSAGLHVSHAPIHDFNAPIVISYPDTVSHGAPDSIYTLKGAISDTLGPMVEYLVVGGGGAGDGGRNSRYYGGGGGGGEVRSGTMHLSGPVFISIGAGGSKGGYFADIATKALSGWGAQTDDGRETLLGPITAIGGRGAFSDPDSNGAGYGGAGGNGYAGANAVKSGVLAGGGGGGAGGAASGINGGPGLASSITGTSIFFGAGGSSRSTVATGITTSRQTAWGASGAGASGCGGGGGGATAGQQFNGGAGVVIIAYPNTYPALAVGSNLTYFTLSTRAGYRVYVFSQGSDTVSVSGPGKTMLYRPDNSVKKIILEGNSSYGGATTVDLDTLEIGDGANGNLGSTPTILTNSSVLVYNKSRNTGIACAISGNGSLRIRNSNIISMRSGPYSYTGPTLIDSGATLRIATNGGQAPFGNIDVYGTLRLERTDVWQNAFGSSSATITIYPRGTLYTYRSFNTIVNPVLAGGSIFMLGGANSSFKSLQIRGGMNVTENSVISANDVDGVTGMLFTNAPITVAAGKTLRVDSPAHFYGSSNFTKNGTGTLDLYRSFLTGPVAINAGTMIVRNGGLNSFGVHNAAVSIASGASLQYLIQPPMGGFPSLYGNLSGAGAFLVSGWGLSLKGNNSGFTGPFTANDRCSIDSTIAGLSNSDSVTIAYVTLNSNGGGTYAFGDLRTGWGGITSTASGSHILDFGSKNKSRTWSNIVSDGTGTVSLIKRGTGTYTTTVNNTYSGTTNIAAGTFQIGNGGTTGTPGAGNIAVSGTLAFNRSNTLTVPNVIFGSGVLSKLGSGTTILTGANTYYGGTTISAGTLQVGDGGTSGAIGTGAVVNNSTLNINRSDSMALPMVISGTGSLKKSGTGILALTGVNTYTGATTVNGGTLVYIGGGTTANASAITVDSNATLRIDKYDVWGNASITSSPLITLKQGTVLRSNKSFTTIWNLVLNGGNVICAGGANSGYRSFQLGGTLTVNDNSVIADSPGTYNGIHAGGSGAPNLTINVATGKTLTIASSVLSTVSFGPNGIVKAGSGTTILTGANTYNGGTTISAGILQVGDGGTSGSIGTGAVVNNSTLNINRSDSMALPMVISGTGSLKKSGTGILALTRVNTYTGATIVNGGTLVYTGGGTTANASAITLDSSATLRLDWNDTWGNAGSTSSPLITLKPGTVLRSNKSFTTIWNLVLNGGSVICAGGSGSVYRSFQLAGTLTVNDNSVIADSPGTTNNAIHLGGSGAPNLTINVAAGKTLNITSSVLSSVNFPPNGLIKTGTGSVFMSGSNSYTGTTTINGGTLKAGNANAFGTGAIIVNSGGTLDKNGFSIPNTITVNPGGIVIP